MATAEARVQPRLKERYEREIKPALIERFAYKSPMQAPRLVKITLNMGVGDAKQDTNMLQAATEQLATIAGQRPNVRRARKSIAAFKLREQMPVGVAVTLRDARMYEFLDRLMSVAIPRIRDFRGLGTRGFDGRGNYNLGVREQIIFPEIDYDAIDQVRGLDINIATTATTDEEAYALLEAFGMPFQRAEQTAADIRREQAERQSREEKAAQSRAEEAAREELQQEDAEAYADPTEAAGDVTPEGAARETGTGSEGAAPTVDEQQQGS
jgi:large subunit ribosomal protein L5